jgi:hypothetical protein
MSAELPASRATRWIGLADVRPLPSNDLLGNARGAVVAVVADAVGVQAFRELVEREMERLQFEVHSLEDVDILARRASQHASPAELVDSTNELSESAPIAFGAFHAYAD